MKKKFLLASLALSAVLGHAQVTIDIDANERGVQVAPTLYGIFFEEINHAGDGGLYAELISNRSFEDGKDIPHWKTVGSGASIKLSNTDLLNKVQSNALQLTLSGKKNQQAGVSNDGFWGINAVQGRTYKLSFWAKAPKGYKGTLTAVLTSQDGTKTYAKTQVSAVLGKTWKKYTATLTSNANDPKANFALMGNAPGTILLDMVSLFPPTFKNRENGCRPDLAQMLLDLHPQFMRFPGGCYVEGQGSPDNAFRWDRTIGPIEERIGHMNQNWGYRVSDGLGYHEFLQLSEDLGAKPLFVVNVGIWHGGFTPYDSIQPWIDECLNAIEYANGPVTSKYGAMRAKNGHPAPFNLEYLEIGNENNQPDVRAQSDHYYERYKQFQDAILAKYPNMHLIGNVVAWGDDNPKWESEVPCELLDEHYYRSPIWFANQFNKYDTYERGKHDIYVGEYAVTQGFGTLGSLRAALGEAIYMMGMENNSDIVKMASYAPIFFHEDGTGWMPDMIRFNSAKAFGTPSYYVQKLLAENVGTQMLKVRLTNPYDAKANPQAEVPAAPCSVGLGSWQTQVTYKDMQVSADGKIITPKDWKAERGQWTGYAQTSMEENCTNVSATTFGGNKYTYTLKGRKDSGNEGLIVVFDYKDSKNYSWLNLGGWGNTQHAIEQTIDGARTPIATKQGTVETGKWYDIRIEVENDSITCFADGQLVLATRYPFVQQGLVANAAIDSKTGETIVKVVNFGGESTTAQVNLNGLGKTTARVIRLTSASEADENTMDAPTHVYPTEQTVSTNQNGVELYVPAHSLNILRVK